MHSRDLRLRATHSENRRPLRARSPPPATWTIGTGSTRLAARPATIKTQRQSTRPALRLDAEEATQWWLGFGDDLQDQRGAKKSLQIDDAVPRRVYKSTTLLIAQVAWTPPV